MARQKGLEPLTYCLEGSCSIQLSYWRKNEIEFGAGDGNRTHTTSLEGWGSTTELHPRVKQCTQFYHTLARMSRAFEKLAAFFAKKIADMDACGLDKTMRRVVS